MDRSDCFANLGKRCNALKVKDCENCNFYKPVKNPEGVRARINREIDRYSINYIEDSGDE